MYSFQRAIYSVILFIVSILCINDNLFSQIVAPDGSFNYSISIELPPGTAGMAPKLALIYNSNCDNGMLGVGWQLAGLPFITRDSSYGIGYDGEDNYAGPGGRLVYISSGTYQGQYHYENESFCRIQASSTNLGDAPAYWVETKPDGTMYYYGFADDSKIIALNNNGSNKTYNSQNCIRVWALSKVVDLYGNYYEIEYAQDNGAYYPTKITYTENVGLSYYRTVEFDYDTTSRNDYYSGYSSNSRVLTKWRLSGINIKVDGTSVRTYSITYDSTIPTSAAVKSRLTSIMDSERENNVILTWNNVTLQ